MSKMNTTDERMVSDGLSQAPYQLNIWFGCLLLIFGNINVFANIIVFSSRNFRNRACSIYLLAQAIILIFFLNFVLLTRTLQKGFQIPLVDRFDFLCRIRYFASQYVNILVVTLFIFASLDRLLAVQRSQKWRKWSNRTTLAYKLIVASIIIWFLLSFHRLIFYNSFTGLCIAQRGLYALVDNYFEALIAGIGPPIVLIMFGYFITKSVRDTSRRRIAPAEPRLNLKPHKSDRQLTQMLLIQTLVATAAFLPYAFDLIYTNLTQNWKKSAERLAWEKLIDEIIRLLTYTFYSTQFYMSLISSRGMRNEILKIFRLRI